MAEKRGPLWTRPDATRPERLTREAVVACAVGLADREGLEAVSVRRVAAELNARPMSLYSFFERKDDLIDLMVDFVQGEMLVDQGVPAPLVGELADEDVEYVCVRLAGARRVCRLSTVRCRSGILSTDSALCSICVGGLP